MTILRYLVLSLLLVSGCSDMRQESMHGEARAMAKRATTPPTPQQMEEAMKKAGTPRPEHRALEPFIGRYNVKTTMWMAPGANPETTTGTAEHTWVMDGRFVSQQFHGSFQGKPFQGEGTLGFNNMTNRYEMTWIDSMSTQIMKLEGTPDATGKVITLTGQYMCPITDAPREMRQVLTMGDKSHTLTAFDRDPEQGEYKSFEVVYNRAEAPAPRKK